MTAAVDGDQDENGAYVGTATVTVTATDTESGVASVEYSLDGGAFAAYTAPVTVSTPGQHTVQFRATDEAGNTSNPQSVAFAVVDAARPGQHRARGDRHGGRRAGRRRRLRSAPRPSPSPPPTTGSGVGTVEYSLDGAPYAAYTAPVVVNQPGCTRSAPAPPTRPATPRAPTTVQFTVAEGPAGRTPPRRP